MVASTFLYYAAKKFFIGNSTTDQIYTSSHDVIQPKCDEMEGNTFHKYYLDMEHETI